MNTILGPVEQDFIRRDDTDEEAIARFERVVLAQPQTPVPWHPVTDYSEEARYAIERPHAQRILDTFHPRHVLDYGAGHGWLTLCLREADPILNVFAYDIEPKGAVVRVDAWLPPWQEPLFDLVICREVLEHLPVRMIARTIHDLCRRSTRYVYATTRLAKAGSHLLDITESDDLDPTHISLMHPIWLRMMFVLQGFHRRADLEAQVDWQHKGRCFVYERHPVRDQ